MSTTSAVQFVAAAPGWRVQIGIMANGAFAPEYPLAGWSVQFDGSVVPVYWDQDAIDAPRMREAVSEESFGRFCYILGPGEEPLNEHVIGAEMDQLEISWAGERTLQARFRIGASDLHALRVHGLQKFAQFVAEPSWERGTSFANWVDAEK